MKKEKLMYEYNISMLSLDTCLKTIVCVMVGNLNHRQTILVCGQS